MEKRFSTREPGKVTPCPKCGNDRHFIARAEQCAEDLCEVWVTCVCGYEPDPSDRIEDVWGRLDEDMIRVALLHWSEMAEEAATAAGGDG